MHIPLGQLLLSRENLLKKILLVYVFILVVNLVLMLSIIPVFGFIGAAWITVFIEALTFISFYFLVSKKIIRSD